MGFVAKDHHRTAGEDSVKKCGTVERCFLTFADRNRHDDTLVHFGNALMTRELDAVLSFRLSNLSLIRDRGWFSRLINNLG